jgi:transposase InsO family protein
MRPRARRVWSLARAVHAPTRTRSVEREEQIVRLRKELSRDGFDAGADTIRSHLLAGAEPGLRVPATSTIWRVLTRRGFVRPQPHKRPRSSWKRFCAEQPSERWQADTTHWHLADGSDVEILNVIDDHSRLLIASQARRVTLGPDVVTTFTAAFQRWGAPAEVLTDNGAIFTAKQRGHSRVALEIDLHRRGIKISPSRPYHP